MLRYNNERGDMVLEKKKKVELEARSCTCKGVIYGPMVAIRSKSKIEYTC